jgi:DNA-binding XRE family transcriptional regulator
MSLPMDAKHEHFLRDQLAALFASVRHDRQLSQEEVAHRAGIDVSTYRRLETRSRSGSHLVCPRFDTVLKLAIALDIEPGAFRAMLLALRVPSTLGDFGWASPAVMVTRDHPMPNGDGNGSFVPSPSL